MGGRGGGRGRQQGKNYFNFTGFGAAFADLRQFFAAVNAKVLTTFRKSFCRVRRRQELVLLGVGMGMGMGVAVSKENFISISTKIRSCVRGFSAAFVVVNAQVLFQGGWGFLSV